MSFRQVFLSEGKIVSFANISRGCAYDMKGLRFGELNAKSGLVVIESDGNWIVGDVSKHPKYVDKRKNYAERYKYFYVIGEWNPDEHRPVDIFCPNENYYSDELPEGVFFGDAKCMSGLYFFRTLHQDRDYPKNYLLSFPLKNPQEEGQRLWIHVIPQLGEEHKRIRYATKDVRIELGMDNDQVFFL